MSADCQECGNGLKISPDFVRTSKNAFGSVVVVVVFILLVN